MCQCQMTANGPDLLRLKTAADIQFEFSCFFRYEKAMTDQKSKQQIPGKPGFFYGYIVVLASSAIWITWGTSTTFGVFLKPLLTEFGWTRAATAGARSLASAVTGLAGIVTGGLTDRFGPRKVILVFGSFIGIGYLLMPRVSNLWEYYAVYGVIIGIGFSTVTIPTMTTIARWFVKRRGLMTGIVQAGSGVGGMILSPLVGWLILTQDWRFAFSVLGIITLVIVFTAGWALQRDPAQMGQLPWGAEETPGQKEKNPGPEGLRATGFSLRQAISTRQFWMLCVMFFAFGLARQTTLTHIAAHVTDLGFSLTTGANMLAVIAGAAIVGRIGTGQLSDNIGCRRAYMVSYSLIAAALLWLLVADKPWMLYLFATAFGFSWGSLAVVRMPMLAEVFGIGSLGAILGAAEVGTAIGAVIGPFFAGWLFDLTSKYTATFAATAAVAGIALIMATLLKPISSTRR